MTIEEIKERDLLLLECISGSKAFGLATPTSDTDIKGVFILPKDRLYALDYVAQVANETNDEVYYELGRFFELLGKNNPNILELLNTPADCLLYRHPVMEQIDPQLCLSKLCRQTFGHYAMTQVKKARGLNKKILNPIARERKSVLDFCFVGYGQGSMPLLQFLKEKGIRQEDCGLSKISHMTDLYSLFHDTQAGYKGIMQSEEANEVSLSSIEKGLQPLAFMSFNKSGYSTYCKDYKEYWHWVGDRNEVRYENTVAHGKRYDAKNMMHTFRLIAMAEEIGQEAKVVVRRPDREFLLDVKAGKYEYEDLLQQAEQRIADLNTIYEASLLPEKPDLSALAVLHVRMREALYK